MNIQSKQLTRMASNEIETVMIIFIEIDKFCMVLVIRLCDWRNKVGRWKWIQLFISFFCLPNGICRFNYSRYRFDDSPFDTQIHTNKTQARKKFDLRICYNWICLLNWMLTWMFTKQFLFFSNEKDKLFCDTFLCLRFHCLSFS